MNIMECVIHDNVPCKNLTLQHLHLIKNNGYDTFLLSFRISSSVTINISRFYSLCQNVVIWHAFVPCDAKNINILIETEYSTLTVYSEM